jgi:hypothetical protein
MLDQFCVKITEGFYQRYLTIMETGGTLDNVALSVYQAMVEIHNNQAKATFGVGIIY